MYSKIKPEFQDIPMDQYVPLDNFIIKELSGIYEINKNCSIRNIKTNRVWSVEDYYIRDDGYPEIKFSKQEGSISKAYLVHILVAKTFLINDDPNNKTIVDHINRIRGGKEGLNINNLRWVTPKENANNITPPSRDKLAFRIYNLSGNFIEQKTYSKFSKKEVANIIQSINNRDGLYKGLRYERVNLEIEDYISKWGNPDPNGWKISRFSNIECNVKGFIRYINSGKLSIGSIKGAGYRAITVDKKSISVHRLIYETFNNIILEDFDQIDHIDGIRDHNELNNLRVCSGKDNMNNPITRQNLSKKVSKINPKEPYNIIETYNSVFEAAKSVGAEDCSNNISYSCTGKILLSYGYLWSYEGKEKEKIDNFINSEKIYHSPKGYWSKDKCTELAKDCTSKSDFIKKYPKAYNSCIRNKWIDEIFPEEKLNNWTDKSICKEEAGKYTKESDFAKYSLSAWCAAKRYGWLREFFPKDPPKPIDLLNMDGEFIKRFNSVDEAAKEVDTTRAEINRVLRGDRKSVRGTRWRYSSSN